MLFVLLSDSRLEWRELKSKEALCLWELEVRPEWGCGRDGGRVGVTS